MHNPERRVQTTKKLLRDALMTLLAEKPLHNVTVKELCLLAGLNRGTFYSHYADVYDLMEQIENEMTAEFHAAIEPLLSDAAHVSPPKMTKQVFECIEANADLCRVIIGPYGDKQFAWKLMYESREKSIRKCREAMPDVDPLKIEAYFTFVTAGCYALMDRWLRSEMTVSTQVLADAAEQIMESGLAFLQ